MNGINGINGMAIYNNQQQQQEQIIGSQFAQAAHGAGARVGAGAGATAPQQIVNGGFQYQLQYGPMTTQDKYSKQLMERDAFGPSKPHETAFEYSQRMNDNPSLHNINNNNMNNTYNNNLNMNMYNMNGNGIYGNESNININYQFQAPMNTNNSNHFNNFNNFNNLNQLSNHDHNLDVENGYPMNVSGLYNYGISHDLHMHSHDAPSNYYNYLTQPPPPQQLPQQLQQPLKSLQSKQDKNENNKNKNIIIMQERLMSPSFDHDHDILSTTIPISSPSPSPSPYSQLPFDLNLQSCSSSTEGSLSYVMNTDENKIFLLCLI